MTILAVTGMTKEAEIVGGAGVISVAGGGDAKSLAQKLEALHGDITGVISIGLGGGLSPLLKVGDVVIADRILMPSLPFARATGADAPKKWGAQGGEVPVAGSASFTRVASEGRRGEFKCDNTWRIALAARLPHAHQGAITGSDVILEGAAAKSALFDATGALVVDMESQVAARFAAGRGLKLACLRIISDDAAHALPPAALVAMLPDGGISLKRVLWSVAKNPLQIAALIRTGRASSKAFAELLRCRDLCGVGLAGLDL